MLKGILDISEKNMHLKNKISINIEVLVAMPLLSLGNPFQ